MGDARWAVVTGAGRGFGQSIARRLATDGANVVLHYNRSAEGAEKLALELRDAGREAFTAQADITSWRAVRQMASDVWERTGGIDVLVNNVGDVAPEQSSWRELREDLVDRVLAVDVKGTLWMTHELGYRMAELGRGAIVNVCSNVVVTGSPRAPQYAASKYGVLGLTKSYAAALAPGVRVNALAPGFIAVPSTLTRADWTTEKARGITGRTLLGRIAEAADLVGVVAFLAGDDAKFITGELLICDGGFSMVGA
jgi:3-oxoacyl-[acyl-carrier protein] reductase